MKCLKNPWESQPFHFYFTVLLDFTLACAPVFLAGKQVSRRLCVFTAKVWGLGAAPGWILTNRGVRGGTEDSPRDDGQSRPAAQHTGTADFFGQQPSLLGS